jgi:hypothetical protein
VLVPPLLSPQKERLEAALRRSRERREAPEKQRTAQAPLIVEVGPYQTSLTGRQVVKPAIRRCGAGSRIRPRSGVGDLTRRQIMAAVDKIAKTRKRGAEGPAQAHPHLPRMVSARAMSTTMCSLDIALETNVQKWTERQRAKRSFQIGIYKFRAEKVDSKEIAYRFSRFHWRAGSPF